ncbi:MAG: hypothetical protein RLZZ596_35 [Pseudomonadota bacterium]
MSYAHSLRIGPRPFAQRVHRFAQNERNNTPNFVSAGLFAVGLAAILVVGQFWLGEEPGSPAISVSQVLQSGGDLTDKLGPTAAGYEDPWGDLDKQIALVNRDQDPWGDLDRQIAFVGMGGTLGDQAGDYPMYPATSAFAGLAGSVGDQAGDYPEYPSAAVIAARALARDGDLSQQMAPTAAGARAVTGRTVVQDPSYLPSQFISEIERAETSELPPQF